MTEMTLGQRIILTFIIVLAILFALALCGWLTGGWDVEAKSDLYEDVPIDANLLAIDKRALDEAYHAQIIKLWTVWLTQGAGDATHFRNGLRTARSAYSQATQAIAKREQTK
jgi:hypothetical protein